MVHYKQTGIPVCRHCQGRFLEKRENFAGIFFIVPPDPTELMDRIRQGFDAFSLNPLSVDNP